MCGKCAANLVNSAAQVRQIFAKCAAKVRRFFFNYIGFLCWKAAQILIHEVRLITLFIRMERVRPVRNIS